MKRHLTFIPAAIAFLSITATRSNAQSKNDTTLRPDNAIQAGEPFLPNAFSPNGDGLNDRFFPVFRETSPYTLYSFRIFNRYGKELYYAANRTAGWDGASQGQPAPSDTYYYYIQLFDTDGRPKELRGSVTLIR